MFKHTASLPPPAPPPLARGGGERRRAAERGRLRGRSCSPTGEQTLSGSLSLGPPATGSPVPRAPDHSKVVFHRAADVRSICRYVSELRHSQSWHRSGFEVNRIVSTKSPAPGSPPHFPLSAHPAKRVGWTVDIESTTPLMHGLTWWSSRVGAESGEISPVQSGLLSRSSESRSNPDSGPPGRRSSDKAISPGREPRLESSHSSPGSRRRQRPHQVTTNPTFTAPPITLML